MNFIILFLGMNTNFKGGAEVLMEINNSLGKSLQYAKIAPTEATRQWQKAKPIFFLDNRLEATNNK